MLKRLRTPLLALVVVGGLTGTALATPSVPAAGFHPMLLSRATLDEPVRINAGDIRFRTKDAVDVTHQTITIDPRGSSGWHTHPGVVLITVKSGGVVRYHADCSSDTYEAGDAFTESGKHAGLVRNASATTPAVSFLTYITPVGAALRVDAPNPGCPSVN